MLEAVVVEALWSGPACCSLQRSRGISTGRRQYVLETPLYPQKQYDERRSRCCRLEGASQGLALRAPRCHGGPLSESCPCTLSGGAPRCIGVRCCWDQADTPLILVRASRWLLPFCGSVCRRRCRSFVGSFNRRWASCWSASDVVDMAVL